MRFCLMLIAFICALIAAAFGFNLIPSNDSIAEVLRLCAGWLSASLAAFIAAHVVNERP